ncbi:hypothetical protein GCM10027416_12340 [Okibacterium endophyticum]
MHNENENQEREAVDAVSSRLAKKFPHLPLNHVADVVEAQYEKMRGARLRDYIPVLVEHGAKQVLRDQAKQN